MNKELLQKALEALDLSQSLLEKSSHHGTILLAYTALAEAIAQPIQPAVTPFGRTYKDHLEQATRWLDSQKSRLHHKDCSSHAPSASCSCGLYMCLTNVHAVINTIDATPPITQPAAPVAQAGPNWLPIESAPSDYTSVLLLIDGAVEIGFRMALGIWHMERPMFAGEPTHWMPLPPPPVMSIKGKTT